MGHRSAVVLMFVALSGGVVNAQIGGPAESDIRSVLDTYVAAYARLDVTTMDKLETEDFVFVQDGVVLTKADQMASLKQPGRTPGNMTFTFSIEKVWSIADAAVVTGKISSASADGKPMFKAAFTHVLRKTAGDWRLQHSHYSTEREAASK